MTIEKFGKTIKQKYPQYQDMSDLELGEKMLAKFPQYQDMITGTDLDSQTTSKASLISSLKNVGQKVVGGLAKAGEFFGQKPLAEGAAISLTTPYAQKMTQESSQQAKETQDLVRQKLHEATLAGDTETKNRLVQLLQRNIQQGTAPTGLEKLMEGAPSSEQVIGSAALTGLTALAPGASRYGVPFKAGTKLLSMSRAAELGGMFGAAHAMTQNKTPVEIAKEAGISALLSAPLPMIAAMFEQFYRSVKVLPEKLYSQVFKATKDDLEMQLRTTAAGKALNPTLAKEMVERGVTGSNEGMAVYSLKKINSIEKQIQQLLPTIDDVAIPVNKKQVVSILGSLRDGYKEMLRTEKSAEATKLIKLLSSKGSLSPQSALTIRRFIDEARSQSAFKLHPNLSIKQGAYKTVADSLRNELKNKVPQFKELINEERIFINAFNSLLDAAVKARNVRLINLTDILLGGGGLASGFPGAGLGAMAGVRAFQLPQVLTKLGQGIEKGIIPAIEKSAPILKELGKRAYYQTIK